MIVASVHLQACSNDCTELSTRLIFNRFQRSISASQIQARGHILVDESCTQAVLYGKEKNAHKPQTYQHMPLCQQ